jgi:excinuclease ABC subunit C
MAMDEKIHEDLKLKVKILPQKPGIYQYFDKTGTIIYVGKAKNLKNRVSSYFNKNLEDGKTRMLVKKIVDIQYMVVDTELDALLLENSLIKKYQPKYNIQLKDDKTYPWICIKNEPFPRVFSTRKVIKDGSKYFGPYPNIKVIQTLLKLFKELFPLRTCNLDLSENKLALNKYKVCLEYHLKNCHGPCALQETKQEYDTYIQQIESIAKGNLHQVLQRLKKLMHQYSVELEFEKAHEVKEQIQHLENYQSKSTIVSPQIHNVDVLSIINEEKVAYFNYLVIGNGAIVHAFSSEVKKKLEETNEDIIGFILPELRARFESQSKEVIVEQEVSLKFSDFDFFIPQRGDKKHLIELSARNANFFRLEKIKKEKLVHPEKHTQRILETIQKDLRLTELPVHIECFDNSNIQGTNAVSACVVFKDAKPSKADYRHFNVKTVVGPDDFATMEEVVYRRYKRLKEEGQTMPQLIIIDGGKGQLSAALNALEKLDLRGKIPIVGIAKRLEEIFFPGDQYPIYLDKRSESLKVIQHLRNEAHRFGITHHRNKRSAGAYVSELDSISGIGPKTKADLMLAFKTIKSIKNANIEELSREIGPAKAQLIFQHFNK